MSIREQYISTITTLMEGVPGVQTVLRNSMVLDDTALPAIIILEGDEYALEADNTARRGGRAPRRVHLNPQILVIADDAPEEVGTILNGIAFEVQKAIELSPELHTIAAAHDGFIKYESMETQFGVGRAMIGMIGIKFTFGYTLQPNRW